MVEHAPNPNVQPKQKISAIANVYIAKTELSGSNVRRGCMIEPITFLASITILFEILHFLL